jgi:hypothetical protein
LLSFYPEENFGFAHVYFWLFWATRGFVRAYFLNDIIMGLEFLRCKFITLASYTPLEYLKNALIGVTFLYFGRKKERKKSLLVYKYTNLYKNKSTNKKTQLTDSIYISGHYAIINGIS